ncbi:thiamine phosphate synthase [Cetobacterium ceti]
MNKIPLGIYGITDSKSGKDKNILQYTEELLQSGVKIIQYREKKKSMKEKYQEALLLKKLVDRYNGIFIINDHVDLAILVDAHGVHIGQDDLPISFIRSLLGENKIIGLSTHSIEEGKKAISDGADYIGIGPIFSTETKEDVISPIGMEYLKYAIENFKIPFVAIGGIKEKNIESLLDLGVKRIALVSELVGDKNTYEKTLKIKNLIEKKYRR